MYRNVRRRLNSHDKRNKLLIIVSIILILCIYLTIDSIDKTSNKKNNSLINSLKIWICPQLSSSSKGYFRVDFVENSLINNSLICKQNDILLVYILSTSRNFQRREAIRRTWAKKKDYQQLNDICFIFIVGLSVYNSSLPYNGDVKREGSIYRDIIQLNINETYQNVVYKEVGALKWSHLYASQIPFLYKTDDDLVIDTLLLSDIVTFFIQNTTGHSFYLQKHIEMQQFVQQMQDVDKYTLFKGQDLGGIKTFRSGKFGIHQLAWNHDLLPPYCSGFGFLYSSFIRDRLYRASLCYATEYVPLVGDVFVSGFLAGAASVRCSGWPVRHAQTGDSCAVLFKERPHLLVCSTPLHRGRQVYADFDTAWQAIRIRHIQHSNNIILPTTTIINKIILPKTTIINKIISPKITMINKIPLINETFNKLIINAEKKEEYFKQNLTNQSLSQNFSNQTNFIKKQ